VPIRLGAVSYLNARPLVFGLDRDPRRFSLRFDVPSACAELLHAGDIDLGLIPSIEFQSGDYRIVPGAAVASKGPVGSVALYSARRPDAIRSIAVDSSSRTSAALLRVLCADYFGIDPAFHSEEPDLERMLTSTDAALLIGDRALFADHRALGVAKIDLGEVWTAFTGLPFVYAFWAGRPGAVGAADCNALARARAEGAANVDAIACLESPRDPARARAISEYLRDNIHYTLDEAELEGLGRFYERAAALGIVGAVKPPVLY
jgi:chorismate dehydratase